MCGTGHFDDRIRPAPAGRGFHLLRQLRVVRRKHQIRAERERKAAPLFLEVGRDHRKRSVELRQFDGKDSEQPQPFDQNRLAELDSRLADPLQGHRGNDCERRLKRIGRRIDDGQPGGGFHEQTAMPGMVRQHALSDPYRLHVPAGSDDAPDAAIAGILRKCLRRIRFRNQAGTLGSRTQYGILHSDQHLSAPRRRNFELLKLRLPGPRPDDSFPGHSSLRVSG